MNIIVQIEGRLGIPIKEEYINQVLTSLRVSTEDCTTEHKYDNMTMWRIINVTKESYENSKEEIKEYFQKLYNIGSISYFSMSAMYEE